MKILIAGMGRSGTSLIMRMFMELGAKTICKDEHYIDNYISAGLEINIGDCLGILNSGDNCVAKTPWLYEICHCEEFNAHNVDLVIIPVRDPKIATLSRLANEMMSISFEQCIPTLEQSFGRTPAGYHYWLDGHEEMRCLSSSLVMLLHQCTKKNIHVSFVPFPEIGNEEVARHWAISIEKYTMELGISSSQISHWLTSNFSAGKTYEQALSGHKELFLDYLRLTMSIKNAEQVPSTEAFIVAHGKYVKKHQDEINAQAKVTEQARAEAEQARTEAEQARAEAEQARAVMRLTTSQLNTIQGSRIWRFSAPIRTLFDAAKKSFRIR